MPKEEAIEMQGVVIETLANSMFRVKLKDDYMILAYPSGRIRKYFIRILPGDIVTVNLSPYDLSKGRITYRHK